MILDIKPGVGIGDLEFGMSRVEVRRVLGEPDEKEKDRFEDDGEVVESEDWHYDKYELSLSFDQDEQWLLTTMAISSEESTLGQLPLMGMSEAQLIEVLKQMGIEDLDHEDMSDKENPSLVRIASDEYGINFWFEEGQLSEIQWTPLLNEEGEIDWPL